jgi:hypothetical protein
MVLFSLACLAVLAAAASPPEIWRQSGRSEFELVLSMALRASGQRADLHNGKFVAKQCQASIQRPALTLHDVYDVYGVMGNGVVSKVRKGIHRISKKTYAIKTIDLSRVRADQRESLRREADIMKTLDQPDMIRIRETFEEGDKLHLVLELGEGAAVLEQTVALELFEYILMKTSVLYSPQLAAIENRQAAPRPGRSKNRKPCSRLTRTGAKVTRHKSPFWTSKLGTALFRDTAWLVLGFMLSLSWRLTII